ncbi:hypothetical protein D3C81_896270 [compost metagenome]
MSRVTLGSVVRSSDWRRCPFIRPRENAPRSGRSLASKRLEASMLARKASSCAASASRWGVSRWLSEFSRVCRLAVRLRSASRSNAWVLAALLVAPSFHCSCRCDAGSAWNSSARWVEAR